MFCWKILKFLIIFQVLSQYCCNFAGTLPHKLLGPTNCRAPQIAELHKLPCPQIAGPHKLPLPRTSKTTAETNDELTDPAKTKRKQRVCVSLFSGWIQFSHPAFIAYGGVPFVDFLHFIS